MGENIKRIFTLAIFFGHVLFENQIHAADSKSTPMSWIKTEVIEDRGGQSIDHYMPKNKNSEERFKERYKARKSTKLVNAHFPVVTKSMSVGKVSEVEASGIKYQVATRPMFILGYDPVSINWLKANRMLLAEKKAIGLVVNIENKEQMDVLQKIVGSNVMMQPTPGDRIAEHLKIKHYPFYMDNKGIMR